MTHYDNYLPFVVADCDRSKYESIFLYNNASSSYFEVTPENYVLDIQFEEDKCVLGFYPNTDEYWLLGDSFIRNFYTIWDEENDQLGFAPHITSSATIERGQPPSAILFQKYNTSQLKIQDYLSYIAMSGLTCGSIISVFVILLGSLFFGDFTLPTRKYLG